MKSKVKRLFIMFGLTVGVKGVNYDIVFNNNIVPEPLLHLYI